MTYEDLKEAINDITEMEYISSIRLGCDCGCGGNRYTYEQMERIDKLGEEAKYKLKALGIEFND